MNRNTKTPQKIIIIRAVTADAQSIRSLETLVWKETVTSSYDLPMFIRFGYVYVAKASTKPVGAIIAFKTNKNEVYVADIFVHPKYQGMKIGEKLYRRLLHDVKGTNIVSFLNPKLTPTINLHKKLGAKTVAKVFNPCGTNKGLEAGMRLFVRIKN